MDHEPSAAVFEASVWAGEVESLNGGKDLMPVAA